MQEKKMEKQIQKYRTDIRDLFSSKVENTSIADTIDRQEEFDTHITNYFLDLVVPLDQIEDIHFRNMFNILNIDKLGLKIMNRRSLERRINDLYMQLREDLKEQLKQTKNISITTICIHWPQKKREYLITTCHWINEDLKRVSRVISCRQFYGCPYYLWVYDIERVENYRDILAGVHDLKELITGEDHFNEDNKKTKEIYISDGVITLQDHMVANNVYVHMFPKYEINSIFDPLVGTPEINEVFLKCKVLWNVIKEPKYHQISQDILGHILSIPEDSDRFKYFSHYEHLQQILSIQDKFKQLYKALELQYSLLDEKDFVLLNDYLKSASSFVEARRLLQDDKDSFYGLFLPCILYPLKKMIKLTNVTDEYNHPKRTLANIEKFIENEFNISLGPTVNAAIAVISYPRFKDKWLSIIDCQLHDKILEAFQREIAKEIPVTPECDINDHNQEKTIGQSDVDNSFFEFEMDTKDLELNTKENKARTLLNQYLADEDTDVSMLQRHEEVKQVFMKYNTTICSLPTNWEQTIFKTLREVHNHIDDQILEKFIVLKCNANL